MIYSYYETLLSCKSLYKWLFILVYVLSCTTLYDWLWILFWVFVMHISVRMTIHSIIDFRHAHLCTNDYPYSFGIDSVMHIFVWMTIHTLVSFCHALLCTNDYPYYFCMGFRHAHLCTNDYFVPNIFPMRFCKMGIVSSLAYLALMCPRFHHARNALQRMNTLVHVRHYNCYYNVYRFSVFEDNNLSVIVL